MGKAVSLFRRVLLSPGHFIFFSIYFVFRMYVINIHDIPFRDFVRPLLVSILAGLVLYLLFGLITGRRHAAALMASMVLFGFYLYGTFWKLVYSTKVIRQPEVFAAIWGIFFLCLIAWLGWKTPKSPNPNIPAGANLMAVILLVSPTIGSLVYFTGLQTPFPSKTDHALQNQPGSATPDIYYIILDSYTRADVLAEEYEYDNRPFLQSLKDLGFYVAECSQSNYDGTPLSLASTLNMEYLQNMSDTFTPDEAELMGLFKLLDNNDVQETVSNFGYKTVTFSSGFLWVEWRDADVFLSPPEGPVTEFEAVLMLSSYLRILDNMEFINLEDIHAERFRARTRFVLNSFDDLVRMPGPKFVFIHLVVPHSPFAFDPMGNPVPADKADPRYGYSDQVKFINRAILPKLKQLIDESPTPPVILLQGDHGPLLPSNSAAKLKILNAYYLPEGSEALYPSISPVNSFRVVFNEYFGADFPLLEDKSYRTPHRYDFTLIPNTCPQQ